MLPRRGAAALLLASLLCALALPAGAAAHVTRTIGDYTLLVILVEEPFFETNHAGFQFWVHRGELSVAGLEDTVRATATRPGATVDLAISPPNAEGFHVLDHTTAGEPFDPRGGGAWTLILAGRIERTDVAETIPVEFPSYPRLAAAPPASAPPGQAAGNGLVIWLMVGAVMAVGLVASLRQRTRPGMVRGGTAPPA